MQDRTETLQIGSRAPEFLLPAVNRDGITSLSGSLKRGVLIIEFMRGTWCPNCGKRMAQLELVKDDIEQAGAQLVYIAAEKGDGLWNPGKFFAQHPVSYPFLLDEDRTVTKAYGLYHRLAIDAFNIAHPASIVVDQERTIRYLYRGDSQSDRAPVEQVLEAARKWRK
ncbi:MAG TPA: redoxin family protein [Terriglobales bacterium]|jgi:peroxiredoxin Q/BCP